MPYRQTRALRVALFALTLLAACSSDSTGGGDTLTIKGASGPVPPAPPALAPVAATPPVAVGDPASFLISVYALYVSPNTDCSSPVQVQNYGAIPSVKDMLTNPTLFSGSVAPGSYPCVAFEMSDVISATTTTTFGNCVMGTSYANDVYQTGETDWKDINLNPIIGSGDDASPVDDHVTIIITQDSVAALARGFSSNQMIPLTTALVSPGTSTFYWDGTGSIQDDGVSCNLEQGVVGFR